MQGLPYHIAARISSLDTHRSYDSCHPKTAIEQHGQHQVPTIENSGNVQALPYEGIFKSRPVKFVVGKAKEEFFLHSTMVANCSEALGKMVNRPVVEGQNRDVQLADDVDDANTFTAFSEFIYSGDYHMPMIPSDMSPPSPSKPRTTWVPPHMRTTKLKATKSKKIEFHTLKTKWLEFTQSKEYGYEDNAAAAPNLNTGNLDTDYSEFFIAHAKVFMFAECYGIVGLTSLAIQKLHKALCGFRLSRERVGDIVALVRFCYERPGSQRLRDLVVSYSVAILDSDITIDHFRGVLKERAAFAEDIALLLGQQLVRSREAL
ncbi:hypothetical protein E4U15_006685 [Claviceps sp. LM218 group G6]|nr:hypothetical protein E4U15_006685 [Claviceps sp. LM218 group G6]